MYPIALPEAQMVEMEEVVKIQVVHSKLALSMKVKRKFKSRCNSKLKLSLTYQTKQLHLVTLVAFYQPRPAVFSEMLYINIKLIQAQLLSSSNPKKSCLSHSFSLLGRPRYKKKL